MLIIEIQYFPSACYFYYLFKDKNIKFEAYEHFAKASFRNRCVIAGSNGLVSLSVPLKNGREQKMPIRQIEIDLDEKWKQTHWRTILSCYKKSPFFDYYSEEVRQLIFSKTSTLFDRNMEIIEWVNKTFRLSINFSQTTEYVPHYEKEVIDLRNKLLPRNFQDEVRCLQKYSQVFENKIGFQPNLSILDLIFNEGPNTINVLRSNI